MNISAGRSLGEVICEALGLDAGKVTRISIVCEPNCVATVEVTQALMTDEEPYIIEELKKYKLESLDG